MKITHYTRIGLLIFKRSFQKKSGLEKLVEIIDMLLSEDLVNRDIELALEKLLCLCSLNPDHVPNESTPTDPLTLSAITLFGFCLTNGITPKWSYEKAFVLYQFAANHNNALAQNQLGYFYGHHACMNDMQPSQEKAFEWYQKAAAQNEPIGLYNLGYIYLNGICVTQDLKKAAELISIAAKEEVAFAQHTLGDWYDVGKHFKEDKEESGHWYYRAAKQGHSASQKIIADSYRLGLRGYPKDIDKAIFWYKEAAGNEHYINNHEACLELGHLYCFGYETTSPDYKKAIKWYSLAADPCSFFSSLGQAYNNLGYCLATGGNGIESDLKSGYENLLYARRYDNKTATENILYFYKSVENQTACRQLSCTDALDIYQKTLDSGIIAAALYIARLYANPINPYANLAKSLEYYQLFINKEQENKDLLDTVFKDNPDHSTKTSIQNIAGTAAPKAKGYAMYEPTKNALLTYFEGYFSHPILHLIAEYSLYNEDPKFEESQRLNYGN